MLKSLQNEIAKRSLVKAGDRIGIALSGGADSVALLHALYEVRNDLGIVLTVLHFHHGIRGADADGDERFVSDLATRLGLECVIGRGDAPAHAKLSGQSLETAARELRYSFFESVLQSGHCDKIATAHTMDDQAETVLMRLVRGAGTRGGGGIYPEKDSSRFIRPMLTVRRPEVEAYLRSLQQDWREDSSNLERKHLRNQVRHDLLPLLAKDFNPNIVRVLARAAEIAQAEEQYWAAEMARLLPLMLLSGKPARGGGRKSSPANEIAINIDAIRRQPLALQRRLLLAVLRERSVEVDFEHIETLVDLLHGKLRLTELPGGWKASRGLRELVLECTSDKKPAGDGYSYPLAVPGELTLREINLLVQARLEPVLPESEGYNSGDAPDPLALQQSGLHQLAVRNWKSGDRFWPGQSKSEKKVKDILQQLRVPASERRMWPVVSAGETLVWVRGARPRSVIIDVEGRSQRLIIEGRELP